MKADPFAQLALLRLQGIDTALDRNRHTQANLPERAEVARLRKVAVEAHNRVVRATTELTDLRRALRKAEDEVASVRARADRDRALLASGNVTSPKQLADLEHEVASLGRRQSDLEDAELEVMEAVEQAESELALAEEADSAAAADLARAEAAEQEALADLGAEQQRLTEERAGSTEGIPADLLSAYQRIRDHGNAIAVGLLRYGRCESCQMELSRVDIAAARAAAVDEVLRCPECQAIMVRSEESGL